jgi:hypothetical protein
MSKTGKKVEIPPKDDESRDNLSIKGHLLQIGLWQGIYNVMDCGLSVVTFFMTEQIIINESPRKHLFIDEGQKNDVVTLRVIDKLNEIRT